MSTNPITDLKALLGEDGSHWIKRNFSRKLDDYGNYGYCLVGGLRHMPGLWVNPWNADKVASLLAMVIREQYPTMLRDFYLHEGVSKSLPENWEPGPNDYIMTFNDFTKTEWSDVEKVLDKTELKWEEEHGK